MTRLAILGVVALAAAGCISTQPELSDEQRIRSAVTEFAAAWAGGHSGLITSMLTEDAELHPHTGDHPIEGRDAIRDALSQGHFPTANLRLYPGQVSVDGETALVLGIFQLRRSNPDSGNLQGHDRRGKFRMALLREAGLWKISRYTWSDSATRREDPRS